MEVIGHDGILRELRSLALGDEPPHALLFAGPEGTGRSLLAREYARLLNCEAAPEQRPCGECRHCRLILEGRHPDVLDLGPGDALCRPRVGESSHEKHPQSRDIRICQVRGLIETVARFPFEGRYRMVVIEPADRLGREASHTLLKTLEEPPGHTILALVSSAPEVIIETILSRCRRIDVRPVGREAIEAGLRTRGIEAALAARAAEASRGRPAQAIAFAARPDMMDDRARLLERYASLADATITERSAYANELTERWRKDRAQVALELDAWDVFWERRLAEAAAGGDRDDARGAVGALRAIATARADLQLQVMTRAALELMLLSFPRRTMPV